jgi:hypothetical protein
VPEIDHFFHAAPPFSIKARESSAFQAVTRWDSLTLAGYLPDLTPAHQVDLETGK